MVSEALNMCFVRGPPSKQSKEVGWGASFVLMKYFAWENIFAECGDSQLII